MTLTVLAAVLGVAVSMIAIVEACARLLRWLKGRRTDAAAGTTDSAVDSAAGTTDSAVDSAQVPDRPALATRARKGLFGRRTLLFGGLAAVVVLGGIVAAAVITSGAGGHGPAPDTSGSPSSSAAVEEQVRRLVVSAQTLLDQGLFKEAAAQARQATRRDPRSIAGYLLLGQAEMFWNQPNANERAASAFEAAIDLGSADAQSRALLAKARFGAAYERKTSDYAAAAAACALALQIDSRNALAHAVLARIAAVEGSPAEVRKQAALALKTGARDAVVLGDVGWAYASLGNWDRSAEYYWRSLDVQPNRPGTHLRLAEAYRQTGHFEESLAQAHDALRLDQGYESDAHTDLGLTLREMGRDDEAVAELKQALELDPSNHYAAWALGALLYGDKQYSDALPYLERSVTAVPDNAGYLEWLGACYKALGRYVEARRALERALEVDPDRKGAQKLLDELTAAGH